jgi:thiosulfate reductase/polysulfide reductase chain A
MGQAESKRAVCTVCPTEYWVLVHSQDGYLVGTEEDRTFPLVDTPQPPTKACIRLQHAREFMYHPDRVNFPLRRAGGKGAGKGGWPLKTGLCKIYRCQVY